MSFDIAKSSLESGVLVVALSGRMTLGSQLQKLESTIEEATKSNQSKIVIDMSQISYLDSSAVGTIVCCNGVVKNAGGQMRLAGMQDRVRTIFKLTGVDRVLLIDPGRDEAVQALGATS